MIKKILKLFIATLFIITLLPSSVHAEEGSGSSPILSSELPLAAHGELKISLPLDQFSDGVATTAKVEVYQDGYTRLVSGNGSLEKIKPAWVLGAFKKIGEDRETQYQWFNGISTLDFDKTIGICPSDYIPGRTLNGWAWIFFDELMNDKIKEVSRFVGSAAMIDLSHVTVLDAKGRTETPDGANFSDYVSLNFLFKGARARKIKFGENWSKLKFGNTEAMFARATAKEIEGLENLKMQPRNAREMFALAWDPNNNGEDSTANLSSLDLTEVTRIDSMFSGSSIDVKDLFSRQRISKIENANFAFQLYKNTKHVIDLTGITQENINPSSYPDYGGFMQNAEILGAKFDFSQFTGRFSGAFSLYANMDTSKMPQPNHVDANGKKPYLANMVVDYIYGLGAQTSFDFSNYSDPNFLESNNVVVRKKGLQIVKTSENTVFNDIGYGLTSEFNLFQESDKYTGRWILKYNTNGSPVAEEKYATKPTDMNNIAGYWVRETKAKGFDLTKNGGRYYETDDSKWIKNSDGTMTYVMPIIDKTQEHYLVEDENPNYRRVDETKEINGKKVSIINYDDKTNKFETTVTNEYTNIVTTTRKLKITKNVDIEDGTSFAFNIKLTGEGVSGVKRIGNVIFNNGEAVVRINGNSSMEIELPANINYEITEQPQTGWAQVSAENTSGVLDTDKEAVFTNKKDAPPTTANTTEVVVEKHLPETYTGTHEDTYFNITVEFSGLTPNTEYKYVNQANQYEERFRSDENGLASVSTSISKTIAVKFVFEGVDQVKYKVRETDVKSLVDNYKIVCTPSIKIFEDDNLINNEGGKTNQDFTSKVYTAKTGKTNRAVLTNDISDVYSATYAKNLTNSSSSQDFEFTGSIRGLRSQDVITLIHTDEDGEQTRKTVKYQGDVTVFSFTLKNGENVEVAGIPKYADIMVTEEESDGYIPNWNNDMTGTSTENREVGIAYSTEWMNPKQEDYIYMTCNNEKAQVISVSKDVRGNAGNKNDKFNFKAKLTDNNDNPYTGNLTLIDAAGNHSELTADAQGYYNFKLADGEKATLSGFAQGTWIKEANVVEDENDYATTAEVIGKQDSKQEGKEITVEIAEEAASTEIKFVNTKGMVVPTNVELSQIGIALIVIGGLAFLLIKRKKKAEKE